MAWWFGQGKSGAAVIDPATGADAGSPDPPPGLHWLTDMHRALFLGDGGRIITAAGAAAMLVLSLPGARLLACRMGGWRRWFHRTCGPLAGRLHVELARVSVGGFLLSSVTGL